MDFRLVDSDWKKELMDAASHGHSELRIICPFIKHAVAKELIKHGRPKFLQVITRFNLRDFASGVSDTSALRLLLKAGAQIRGVKNLHAKLYLFNDTRAILTSANLTMAALTRNHEFGFIATDEAVVRPCHNYFDGLWGQAGSDLEVDRINVWDEKLEQYLATGAQPIHQNGLGDDGVSTGDFDSPPTGQGGFIAEAGQTFVKFFGISSKRKSRSISVLQELQEDGPHWACSYPPNKRPRIVKDGDIMYMGVMVREPDDILIFGRAIAMKHNEKRDVASEADIKSRDWKEFWPNYIRVHHAEFVAGTIANGISFNQLKRELKALSFETTKQKLKQGKNADPNTAYGQQPAVRMSAEGRAWLAERLDLAFELHGKLPQDDLDKLDWPEWCAEWK